MAIMMDPQHATCPECARPFNEKTLRGSEHMDKDKGTIYVHQCECGVQMGIFIEDNPKPGEVYTLEKVKR